MDKVYVMIFSNVIQLNSVTKVCPDTDTITGWVYWVTEKKRPNLV